MLASDLVGRLEAGHHIDRHHPTHHMLASDLVGRLETGYQHHLLRYFRRKSPFQYHNSHIRCSNPILTGNPRNQFRKAPHRLLHRLRHNMPVHGHSSRIDCSIPLLSGKPQNRFRKAPHRLLRRRRHNMPVRGHSSRIDCSIHLPWGKSHHLDPPLHMSLKKRWRTKARTPGAVALSMASFWFAKMRSTSCWLGEQIMICIEPSLSIGVGGPIPAAIRHIVQDLKKVCRGMEGGVFLLGLEE